MTDLNRAVPSPAPSAGVRHRASMVGAGPRFDRLDVYAFIAAAVMMLGPLVMGAFWAPHP